MAFQHLDRLSSMQLIDSVFYRVFLLLRVIASPPELRIIKSVGSPTNSRLCELRIDYLIEDG